MRPSRWYNRSNNQESLPLEVGDDAASNEESGVSSSDGESQSPSSTQSLQDCRIYSDADSCRGSSRSSLYPTGLNANQPNRGTISPARFLSRLTHVQVRCNVSGGHFAFAGVGRPPDYLVPTDNFQIEEVVGQYLLEVEFGEVKYENGSPVCSKMRVSGIIDPRYLREFMPFSPQVEI